jgi:hypothetical protein
MLKAVNVMFLKEHGLVQMVQGFLLVYVKPYALARSYDFAHAAPPFLNPFAESSVRQAEFESA